MNPIVTISGGGIIGNYISLRLNKNNIETIIIERSPQFNDQNKNIRTLTLNPFSKRLLDDIGIKLPLAEIKNINVFDGDGSGKINFCANEVDEENLSYVAFFDDLQAELQKEEQTKTFFGTQIEKINSDDSSGLSEIHLSNNDMIKTKFIAGCDGRKSRVAKLASLDEIEGNYNQTAITFTVKCTLSEKDIAYQIFSEKGIFAIMPVASNEQGSTHTVVWSVDDKRLGELDTKAYIDENISYFEQKLVSDIKINSEILSFKLFNHHFENYISGSTVLIGDAAHSIHPLAGQGINLGFADADAFCEEIIKGYENSINIDQRLVLKKYEIRRKNMNLLMLKSMDFFVNIFRSNNLFLKLLRNIGLSSVDKNKFLKRFFINHASGKNKI